MRHTYFGWFVTLPRMREMSVTEQRYKAVLAVIGDGRTVSEVATSLMKPRSIDLVHRRR